MFRLLLLKDIFLLNDYPENFIKTCFKQCILVSYRGYFYSWKETSFNNLVVKALDSQSKGPVFKTTGWLQGRLSLSSFRGR